MFIDPAYAQTPGAGGGADILMQMLPFVAIFAVMYFLIIRPQQRRVKEHRETVNNIKRGDTVVTSGGIIGKVTRVVDNNEIQVEVADNVRIRVVKSTISEVRAKGEAPKEGESTT